MNVVKQRYSDEETVRIGRHVTWVGFWVNAVLGVLKVLAGIIGRSSAMIADGIHSFSDFATDMIVIVMLGKSRRGANATYQYGHGKYETLATMLIAIVLAIVALGIFYEGADQIWKFMRGESLPEPRMLALAMAIISILAKEGLFHYTRIWGERIHSGAVVANAWHHRSDAISSAATLLGIAGAMFLGEKWRILDPIAAIVVSVFVMIMAIRTARPSILELLEVSLPPELASKIKDVIRSTPGVVTYHHFRSRRNGNAIIVDFHIKVLPEISLIRGHEISTNVERRLHEEFGADLMASIHVEPYLNQQIRPDGSCMD